MKRINKIILSLVALTAIAFAASDGFGLINGTAAFFIGLMIAAPCFFKIHKNAIKTAVPYEDTI